MTTLYIFGDSFTVPPELVVGDSQRGLWASPGDTWSSGKPKPKTQTWINQVAAHLSTLHTNLDLINYSQHGVAQDFCWMHINNAIDKITPEDYVIVAVTHPNRFWYIQEHPNLSNHHIINFQQYISKEQSDAIQGFMQHIQRPELDTLHQTNRCKSLAYEVLKRGLRKPLMMNCFFTDITEVAGIDDLVWAEGNLFNIQAEEYEDGEEDSTNYFQGVDCRYNHMCMSNHKIMADKVIAAFTQEQGIDLNQGFQKALLKKDSLKDEEFCRRELDWDKMQLILAQSQKTKPKWSVLK
jgi:hypothetical protein